MKLTRRRFLETTAAAAAVSAAGCKALERGYPERYSVEKPAVPGASGWRRGEERFLRSACLQCEGGCGIVVRVVEGRAVRIEGNPDYPTNQGGLCPKGLNGLQVLYDPDRIRGPLARDGERGSGRWKRVSWDEAVARVARHLSALRARGESHTVAVLGGRYRGHMRTLVRRFLAAYGSPNEIDHESIGASGDLVAHELTQGVRDHLAYDWERTRYVIAFGAALIESFRPTTMMLRVFGQLRGRAGRRAKTVIVDPRFGVSAARADEWVPVRPGTDGALALGIAHVLVRDRLHDEAFVREHTHGFEAWTDEAGRRHAGFRELLLERYAPERVARIADVPAETIERLAHELAGNRPAVAVSGRGATGHSNGVWNALAIDALNALLGSIDAPGGVLVQRQPPLSAWPEPELDGVARRGLSQPRFDLAGEGAPPFSVSRMSAMAERLEKGWPYPLGAVFVYYTNPLFSAPEPERLRRALDRVPLVVSFSPFMDESTAMADLVLPDHTYLERWQLDLVTPSVGFPVLAMRQPVVAPLHDTRSTGQALVDIAHAVGGAVARAFPGDELGMLKHLVRGVHESGRGSVRAASFEEFWEKLLAAGGWWDPPYTFGRWSEVLRTPSGKYEFCPTRLRERLGGLDGEALARLGVSARGDEALLPHHEPIAVSPGDAALPFSLVSYKTMTHAEGRGANQPHLQEMFNVQFDRRWEPWIEIDPRDARALGVKSDDEVWVESPQGRMKVKAVVEEGTRPGVVAVPFEYGHSGYGRWAAARGDNVNRLSCIGCDPLGGSAAWYDVRVALRKA